MANAEAPILVVAEAVPSGRTRGGGDELVVTVRYWAAARAAAGLAEETVAADDVGALLKVIGERHDLGRVLSVSSLLVDGAPVRRDEVDHRLAADAVVDVLPPFAGG